MAREIGRLGKGLRAIVHMEETPSEVISIDVTKIEPNPFQPRKEFDDEGIEELAQSILRDGVLQPVVVSRYKDRYRLVFGERRWRAALLAKVPTIPAIVREASEEESFRWALIENIHRKDLNPMEKAKALSNYIQRFSLTQEKAGEALKMARSTVTNLLRLLALPDEVQRMIESGVLSAGHAKLLLALPQEKILEEAKRIAKGKEPVRRTAKRVSIKLPQEKVLEEGLSEKLSRRVTIKRKKKGGGVVEIEYYSDTDLSVLIDALYSIK